jgi:hypothetical protein
MNETYLASLQRRIKGMHSLWDEALSTMTLEQVNFFERDGVLPIAFSVNHMARIEDQTVQVLFKGETPIWNRDGWAEKVGVTVDDAGKELTVQEMQELRFTDYGAFCDFAAAVFATTEAWLDGLDPARLTEELFDGIVPPLFQKAYVARVVGDGPILLLDGIECWVFQHGIRHLGELEHARALVGLGGMTS